MAKRESTQTAAVTTMTAAQFQKAQKPKKTKTNTNALTQSVIMRINFTAGCMAFRVNNGGVYDPTKKVFRTPKNGTKGISDIIACIKGQYLSIEIKTGKDAQSEGQILFENNVIKAGGKYIIVSDIIHFEKWFKEYLSNI
jgi:hypothetical protein